MGRIIDLPGVNTVNNSTDKIIVETPDGTKIAPVDVLLGGVYDGVDLTVKFADEIANFDNAWAWIQNRCQIRNYEGLRVGDYIPITMNGYTVKPQIAGIEPYLNATDVPLAGHIDFISKDLWNTLVQYNTSNVNQGNATDPSPYMVSNVHSYLVNTLASYLPAELSSKILNKRSLMETRYTDGSTLTSSTSWAWKDLGKLWLPHETEVYGYRQWSGQYGCGNPVQYDIFRGGRNIVKGLGNGGSRANWWLCDVMDASSTGACFVNYHGYANLTYASTAGVGVLVCFRIGYNA
ncbi:MAG: DUF6273 domain-containing protein [Parabacteroides sp.]|nr:DUF6273 domain-containing protein [Parabacteroides sp.]